jgi:hypothetical protein
MSRPPHALRRLVRLAPIVAALTFSSCLPSQRLPGGARYAGGWLNLLVDPAVQWRGYRQDSLPGGWRFDPATRELTRAAAAGDLITRAQWSDFELELEWKVGPRGNSGIFYRANEGTTRIYENAPEYQILDNTGHPDGRNSGTSAGANYALHAPAADVTRPVGEWNEARIVAVGAHVEHWLNGVKVVEYEMGSADWAARVQASKFAQWPTYGLATRGHIGLQDHGDVVSFRNIRIRELGR